MRLFAVASLALAVAGCGEPTGFTVKDAAFQPPLGAGDVGVAYFTIRSAKADAIVKVSSPAAKAVEIHEMKMAGDMMSMARRDTVDLPAGRAVEFKPNGLHLMVFSPDLAEHPQTFPITIQLQSGLTKTIEFTERNQPGRRPG
jgi:copper(I)-binding protein